MGCEGPDCPSQSISTAGCGPRARVSTLFRGCADNVQGGQTPKIWLRHGTVRTPLPRLQWPAAAARRSPANGPLVGPGGHRRARIEEASLPGRGRTSPCRPRGGLRTGHLQFGSPLKPSGPANRNTAGSRDPVERRARAQRRREKQNHSSRRTAAAKAAASERRLRGGLSPRLAHLVPVRARVGSSALSRRCGRSSL